MPTQVQFRRGNTAQNNSFTGAVAEITVDTSTNTLRVHDAVTAGGTPIMPTLRLTNAQRLTTTPQLGQIVFVTDYATAGVSPTWIGDGTTAGGVIAAGGAIASASTATNLAAGTAGQVPFQTGPGVTSFFGPGTFGQVLLSGGTNGPEYTNTLTITGGVVRVSGNTAATSTATGAFVVTGGAGIGGDLFVGGKIVSQRLEIQLTTVTTTLIQTDDIIQTSNTSPTNSAVTGALQIAGGGGFGGSLFVAGNVTATTFFGAMSQSLTAGTGLTGSAYNGSAAQTWTLNTATLMTTAVNLASGTGGQLAYQTAANATGFVSTATTGNFLQANFNGAPTWTTTANIYVQNSVLSTNIRGGTAGQVPYQTGDGATAFYGPGTAGQILVSAGTSAPTYTNTSSIYVNSAVFAEDLYGGVAGSLPYQSAANTTVFLGIGTNGFVLTSNGSAPVWSAVSGLSAGNATTATNLAGGTAGQVPYQTAAGATAFYGPGTAGQILVSAGTGAPTYTNTASIYVNRATLADNDAGGVAGQIRYQTAPNTSAFINTATTGNFLQANFNGAPTWTTTGSMYVARANLADTATRVSNLLTAGTGITGTAFDGSSAQTWTLNTATLMQVATQVVQSHSTGTGILGAAYNGSTAQTWSLDTSTLMARSVQTVQSLTFNNSNTGDISGTTFNGSTARTVSANTLGALSLSAGGTVSGAVTFSGPVTFSGTSTFVLSTQTFYTDNILNLHVPPGGVDSLWTVDDGKDIGFKFHYFNNSTDTHAALVLANDSKFLEFYATGAEGTSTFAGSYYGVFKTGNVIAGRGLRVGSLADTTATVVGEKLTVFGGIYSDSIVTATTFVGAMSQSLTAGTGLTGSAYNGSAAQTWTLNTATLMQVATQVVQSHSTGTGILGTAYNGSTAQTWTLDTSTLMRTAVNLGSGAGGSIPYQTAANATAFLGIGTNGFVLTSNGTAPTWSAVSGLSAGNATTATNLAGGTTGQVPYQTAAGATAFYGPGTAGQFLQSNGAGAPSYVNTSSMYVNSSVFSEDLYGGVGGSLPYQSAANLTAFISTATTGNFLQANFNGAPTWTTTASMYVQNAVISTNLRGGTAGQIAYQSGAGTTAFAGPGTAGQILVSAGAAAPTYTNTASIYVQDANVSTNLRGGAAGQFAVQSSANVTTFVSTGSMYVARAVLADSVTGSAGSLVNALTIGTGLSGTAGSYNGSTPVTISLNTATLVQTATQVVQSHNTGTGILGVAYNGSTAQTWSLDTSTLMARAVQTVQSLTAGTGLTGTAFNGSTAQTWTLNTATLMQTSVNLASGAGGSIPYQTAANATAFLGIGTSGFVLTSNGSVPTWSALSGLSAGTATTATNLAGGLAGSMPYQSAPGSTTFVGIGASNSILVSNGSVPSWSTSPTIGGNVTITGNLTVQGVTTTVDSTNTNIADPVITIGGGANGAAPTLDDGRDRGIAFQWHNGTGPRTGFFGFDRSSQTFFFLTSATFVNEVAAPAGGTTRGALDANLAGGATGSLPYQSAANATTFLGIGSAGQVLTVSGGVPAWAAATTITSGGTSGTLTAGTGLSGTAFNGSANVTWTNAGVTSLAAGTFLSVNASTGAVTISTNGTSANTASTLVARDASGNFSAGTITASLSGNASSASDSSLLNGISAVNLFNNMGQTHSTRTGFDATTPSYGFGFRYVQGNTNSPGTGGTQFYSWYIGLGSDYPSTGAGSYGAMFAVDRDRTNPYLSVRYNEGNVFGTWRRINAGFADTAGALTTANNYQMNSLGVNTAASGTAGEIRATNEITAYYSDRRLKENVVVIANAVDKVKSLHGITYTPNDLAESFGYDKTVKLVGLFADEVEAVLPEATRPAPFDVDENGNSKSGENYKTIQYEKVVPLLVEAIKEQQSMIDALKAELSEVKKLIGK